MNIIYEGATTDITSDGRILLKVKAFTNEEWKRIMNRLSGIPSDYKPIDVTQKYLDKLASTINSTVEESNFVRNRVLA